MVIAPAEDIQEKHSKVFTPPYRRIEADIRARIDAREWAEGSMLPSRRDLARIYSVDVNTIQRAIALLLDDGVVRAEPARGTFVESLAKKPAPGALVSGTPAPIKRSRPRSLVATVGLLAQISPETAGNYEYRDLWAGQIVRAFEQACGREPGVTLRFRPRTQAVGNKALDCGAEAAKHLVADGANAIVALLGDDSEVDEILAAVETSGVPVVFVTLDLPIVRPVPHVIYDSVYAGHQAASHLIQRGYTNISFFSAFRSRFGDERLRGAREAVKGLRGSAHFASESQSDNSFDIQTLDQYAASLKIAPEFLEQRMDRWGIVAVNDYAAAALIDSAAKRGMTAGKDFGLVGFDDLAIARTLGLTTFRPPFDQMGEEAAKLVCAALSGEPIPMQIRLRSHVVPRESTKQPEH